MGGGCLGDRRYRASSSRSASTGLARMIESSIGIIGMARQLPDTIRTNNDPIFDWIHKHHPDGEGLFTRYDKRHVLAEGETVLDILTPAARIAIHHTRLEPPPFHTLTA